MDHLGWIQLMELERQMAFGPLFDQSQMHLADCALCRKRIIYLESLRALALEGSRKPPKKLAQQTLNQCRNLALSYELNRLVKGAPEPGRPILKPTGSNLFINLGVAVILLLLLSSVVAFWHFYSKENTPAFPSTPNLPWEFSAVENETAVLDSDSKQHQFEKEIEKEGIRRLRQHLSRPAPTIVATVAPTLIPALPPPPTAVPAVETKPTEVVFKFEERPDLSSLKNQPVLTSTPVKEIEGAARLKISRENFSPLKGQRCVFELEFPQKASLEIRIFDLEGKSIRLVTDSLAGPGKIKFEWDGRSDSGKIQYPGQYLARIMTRWFSRVETIEIVK
jgi:hypothetical protein